MPKKPAVVLSYNPPGPTFNISSQCQMPDITVTASLVDVTLDPKTVVQYRWSATLTFNGRHKGRHVAHSVGRTTAHPVMTEVSNKNTFKIPFSKVRGGDLTVQVTVFAGTLHLAAASKGLTIEGTNPSDYELGLVAKPVAAFRKLMWVESRRQQFLTAGMPYFSEDGLGGVGICQVTHPRPTDDEVWNWKMNVAAGWEIYQAKESEARAHPKAVRNSKGFQNLVSDYNTERHKLAVAAEAKAAAAAKPPVKPKEVPKKDLTITIPDYNDEQLQRTTIRLFNGSPRIWEYVPRMEERPATEGKVSSFLFVKVDEGSQTGVCEWEEVSAERRLAEYDKPDENGRTVPVNGRGDPDYVEHVLASPSF